MYCTDYSVDYNLFEIGYCGNLNFPCAHIQLEQATNLIPSSFQEEYHSFIHDTLNNKKDTIGFLFFLQT